MIPSISQPTISIKKSLLLIKTPMPTTKPNKVSQKIGFWLSLPTYNSPNHPTVAVIKLKESKKITAKTLISSFSVNHRERSNIWDQIKGSTIPIIVKNKNNIKTQIKK